MIPGSLSSHLYVSTHWFTGDASVVHQVHWITMLQSLQKFMTSKVNHNTERICAISICTRFYPRSTSWHLANSDFFFASVCNIGVAYLLEMESVSRFARPTICGIWWKKFPPACLKCDLECRRGSIFLLVKNFVILWATVIPFYKIRIE